MGCFATLLYRARDDRPELVRWAAAVAIYSVALFSPLRDFLITAMGHGAEILFAGIFLHRALSGDQVLRSEERPLYAFLGLFILIYDARFAHELMSSHSSREAYGDAKGGGHAMDFDLIADRVPAPAAPGRRRPLPVRLRPDAGGQLPGPSIRQPAPVKSADRRSTSRRCSPGNARQMIAIGPVAPDRPAPGPRAPISLT